MLSLFLRRRIFMVRGRKITLLQNDAFWIEASTI
jgi:hypothetical protein